MEISLTHRFLVEVTGTSGAKLGDYPLQDVDFEPAVHSAHLQDVREMAREGRGPLTAAPPSARIEPVPCSERGAPYIGGFRVCFPGPQRGIEFPKSLLHVDVVRGSSVLVRQGLLHNGERFTYRVCAFPLEATAAVDVDFAFESATPVLEAAMSELPAQRRVMGNTWNDADLAVVIAQPVLDEALRLARGAGDVETGGLLLGRRCRNAQSGDLFVDIAALITAPGAIATETSLRFGPESFAAVEQTLALRNCGEEMVGWWHSHPHFCARCPVTQRVDCIYATPFFSQADRDVHRTLFPQAHSQALLVSDLGAGEPSIDLFGWRGGLIQARGFYAAGPAHIPTVRLPAETRRLVKEDHSS